MKIHIKYFWIVILLFFQFNASSQLVIEDWTKTIELIQLYKQREATKQIMKRRYLSNRYPDPIKANLEARVMQVMNDIFGGAPSFSDSVLDGLLIDENLSWKKHIKILK